MARKQLRTVKKGDRTGRLDRQAVRAVVIAVRDGRDELDGVRSKAAGRTRKQACEPARA